MLPKKERLSKKDMELFFQSRSRSYQGKLITIRLQRNTLLKNRWSAVVSSGVKKNAPARNVTRRRTYAVVGEANKSLIQGVDVAIFIKLISKKPPSYKSLHDDIINTLHICKLYR